jgi:hypothetical protein
MINELKEFANLGGTVFTVVAFLYYLRKKDETEQKKEEEFNKIINNHLHSSNQTIEKNTDALKSVAVNLKELTIYIKKLNGKKLKVK